MTIASVSPATVAAIHTEQEYGVYLPGRRIEIERAPWDEESISGWGPGKVAKYDDFWFLTQRDDHSPHPLTWHSVRFHTLEEALRRETELRIDHARETGEDWRLLIPGVSEIAFAIHWCSLTGCYSRIKEFPDEGIGALASCRIDGKCIDKAMRIVREIAKQSVMELIAYGERDGG